MVKSIKKLNSIVLVVIGVLGLFLPVLAEEEGERPERASGYTEQSSISAHFQARLLRQEAFPSAAPWTAVGPFQMDGESVGRFNCVAVDPKNDDILYAGAGGGGVWKSTDGGDTYTDVFLNGDQSTGAITVDPNNSNIVWIGGGENMYGGGSHTYPGTGVWKSTDGGASWTHMGLNGTFYINRVTVTPGNSNQVFVAAQGSVWGKSQERGVYRSQDGGLTWTQVLGPQSTFIPTTDDSTGAVDVRVHPTIPTRVFANMFSAHRMPYQRFWGGSSSRVWRSDDGGTTWQVLGSAEGLPTSDIGMNKMDFSYKFPNFWYMVYFTSGNAMKAVYKSTDGGMTWGTVNMTASQGNSMYSYYGHTFGEIRVNPSNPNEVAVLGLQSFCTENGGNSFSRCYSQGHVDHRGMAWAHNDDGITYLAQDGGLSKTTSGPFGNLVTTGFGPTHDGNYNASLLYSLDIDPTDANTIYTGFQDNGTCRTTDGGRTWELLIGGDGMQVRIDHGQPNIVYGGWQYGGFQRSSNGGNSFSQLSGYTGRKLWDSGIAIDRTNGNVYIGSHTVHRGARGSNNFTSISQDLSNGDHSVANYEMGTISAIGALNNVVYAGTDDGNVWVNKSAHNSTNWTQIRNGELGGPVTTGDRRYNGWVKLISPDFNDASGATAYVSVSFWRWGPVHWQPAIWKLTNHGDGGMGGANWTDIQGNLPPVFTTNKVVSDSRNNLYVGTDYGVYYSTDQGVNWRWLGDKALPIVPVNDIHVHVATDRLYIGTFGRGVWHTDISALPPSSVKSDLKLSGQFLKSFPNPVASSARIEFRVRHDQPLDVAIYNFRGKKIRTLMDANVKAKKAYTLTWDRKDNSGNIVGKGNYILRAIGDKATLAQKITVK